jgi:hypothetical protein
MTIRSPDTLRVMLDSIMSGLSWKAAMARVGARSEGAGWQWKANSREAEQAGDETSIYFLDWPVGSKRQWFHYLLDVARDRRGALLSTPLLKGEFAVIDGKIAFERDDFGMIVLDDLGVPVVERVAIVEPITGKHRPNPDAVRDAARRELAPASYSGNKPPAPIPPPNALSDYLKATGKNAKQPTPLQRDLLDKLAELKANGPKNKPSGPVEILGRGGNTDPPERLSQPSNQEGLPVRFADAPRREAPQAQPAPVDYSRRAPPIRLDSAGRG